MSTSCRFKAILIILLSPLVVAGRTREPQDANRIAAERLAREAEELRRAGDGESLRKAIDKLVESGSLWHTAGDGAGEAGALFQISAIYRLLGDNGRAAEFLDKTLPLKRALGDSKGVVDTLGLIGAIAYSGGDTERAIGAYEEAISLARNVSYRQGEGRTLSRLGLLLTSIGDYPKAIEVQTQSLRIAQAEGDRLGEAGIFLNAGLAERLSGDTQKALEHYREALTLFQDLADRPQDPQKLNNIHVGEAQAIENIGVIYGLLGDGEAALQWFDKALSLYRNGGNRQQEARMLSNIGSVHLASKDYVKASELFKQALTLARSVGDRTVQGETLENLADLSSRMGNDREALDFATQALNTLQAGRDVRGQATVYLRMGSIHYNLGERTKAQDAYNQALELTRTLRYSGGEAQALVGLAHIDQDDGSLETARERMEMALALIESVRGNVAIHDLRISYFASTQDDYEFYIDLLMQLHKEHPSEGFDALAFQTTERARARGLLELLAEVHADVRRGVDPALLEQERSRQQRLDATALRYMALLNDPKSKTQAAVVLSEMENQSRELGEVEAQIRLKSPRYAALTQPHPLTVREIQQDILDPGTALLEYELGTKRSYLWLVTKTSLTAHELPPRAAIEQLAHRVYDQLTARQPKPGRPALSRARLAEVDAQYPSDAAALSKTLLGPIRRDLGTRRLIIVSDGVLQYLPFSALPVPVTGNSEQSGRSLIAEHEIVSMPSASALGLLRQDLATRVPATKGTLIFADPVFDNNDARVRTSFNRSEPPAQETILTSPLRRAARAADLTDSQGNLPRLIFSRREAAGIMSADSTGEVSLALDFDANRQTALSPQLSEYRIIHFATHAILNSEYPELSGIVLSLVDRDGTPRDGFLRLHDLYNLNLPAELVVLSACQTGLGKDIKGEGLIGLTRGFMHAGTARVIASLWKVDDAATAELMKEFYQGMFGSRHLPPAAALRAAQQTISRQKQWASPYYWAGFVLQGDWTGWHK